MQCFLNLENRWHAGMNGDEGLTSVLENGFRAADVWNETLDCTSETVDHYVNLLHGDERITSD